MDLKLPKTNWFVLSAKARIDSFNQNALRDQLRRAQESGFTKIALDVHATRFISLAAIQFLVGFAKTMRTRSGEFALLAPSEKTKRHFEIYGTLDAISLIRRSADVEIGESVELGKDTVNENSRPETSGDRELPELP